VEAARAMPASHGSEADAAGLAVRAAVHRGPALTATLNDQLDYFGATVHLAMALPLAGRPGDLVLSEQAAADPHVAALLAQAGLRPTVERADLPGVGAALVHRVPLAGAGAVAADGA
jgi:class 3 adenylate cyclase